MCKHLVELGCEEGSPVYDSDQAGPKDIPNVSCESFCRTSQVRGSFLNPRCLLTVKTCEDIEVVRQRKPSTCPIEETK